MIERWLMNMCYKAEVQKRNEEKLNKMLRNENVPDFIQDYFLSISSRAARINYWTTIRNTLNWLIEKKYIECKSISDISPEILDKVTDSKIIRYLDYLKETGIKLSTLVTKKNQLSSFWQWMKDRHYCKDNIIQLIKSNEYKVIIMGDVQQLTPIGNCQVFADILDSNVLPVVKLTKPHRQHFVMFDDTLSIT